MNIWIKVVRYHLVDWFTFAVYPWAIQAIVLVVNLLIFAHLTPSPGAHGQLYAGAVAAIYIVFIVLGARSVSSRLPFALALGVSRRSFYTGTALLGAGLAAIDGLLLTLLQFIERGTGGWGMRLHFFRVPFLLAGPWYLTWITSFVGLALMFAWGIWFGMVWQRWNMGGLVAFLSVQTTVATVLLVAAFQGHVWHGVGRFFTALTVWGVTGLLVVLAAAMLTGGYATLRRATV